jgi:hypothetical protein
VFFPLECSSRFWWGVLLWRFVHQFLLGGVGDVFTILDGFFIFYFFLEVFGFYSVRGFADGLLRIYTMDGWMYMV